MGASLVPVQTGFPGEPECAVDLDGRVGGMGDRPLRIEQGDAREVEEFGAIVIGVPACTVAHHSCAIDETR